MSDFRPYDHALAALLGLALPLAAVLSQRSGAREPRLEPSERIATWWANSALLGLLGALVAAAWMASGRGLAELGLRAPAPEQLRPALLLAALAVLAYAADAWWKMGSQARLERTRARWRERLALLPESGRERWHFAALAVSAGVCEELAFRGHLVPWVRSFTGESALGLVLALVLPALPFAIAHLWQGALDAAKTFALALLFGALLLLTRSLWIPILLHVGIDLASSELALRRLRPPGSDPGSDPGSHTDAVQHEHRAHAERE